MHKIYPKEWLEYHPYTTTNATDRYYCDLVNKLTKVIYKYDIMAGSPTFKDGTYEETALFLGGWFEDIISQTGLWQVFTSECEKRYGSKLPFYTLTEDYYPDEINLEDVKFILWHSLQRQNIGKSIYNPENAGLAELAEEIYSILDNEYETAPENERLQEFFDFSPLTKDDFLEYRDRIEWFYMNSYINLGCFENYADSMEKQIEKLENEKRYDARTIDTLLYGHKINTVLFSRTPLLAITAPEYIKRQQESQGARQDAPYLNIDSREEALYLIENEADEYYTFKELIAPQKSYKVVKKSLASTLEDVVPGDTLVTSTLFKYGEYWHHNGVMTSYSIRKNPGILDDIKKIESTSSAQNAKTAYTDFLTATKGKRILFFKNADAMNRFFRTGLKYKTPANLNFPGPKDAAILLSATPKTGLCFIIHLCECIASPENPFYNQKTAEANAIGLLADKNGLPYELACYLLDQGYLKDAGLNSIYGPEHGRTLVQKNARFILDYFFNKCREKDYTEPE